MKLHINKIVCSQFIKGTDTYPRTTIYTDHEIATFHTPADAIHITVSFDGIPETAFKITPPTNMRGIQIQNEINRRIFVPNGHTLQQLLDAIFEALQNW